VQVDAEEQREGGEHILVRSHRDLRRNIRAICRRLNANPEIARLTLVNAVLAFEDVGVTLNAEMKEHIRRTLQEPPRLRERREALERELIEELPVLRSGAELPRTNAQRARFLFDALGLAPLSHEDLRGVSRKRLAAYVAAHPSVEKLVRWERARRGGFVLHTRGSYRAFKEGRRRHPWVKSIRFEV